jgi:hypothetical protein
MGVISGDDTMCSCMGRQTNFFLTHSHVQVCYMDMQVIYPGMSDEEINQHGGRLASTKNEYVFHT